jgi:hypothetical protein
MRIEGRWLVGSDGVERPVVDGYLSGSDGTQLPLSLLIDTGADLSILAPEIAQRFTGVDQPIPTGGSATGIGGSLPMFELAVDLLLPTKSGQRVRIHGPLPILLEPGSLELSVIGRDVLDKFTFVYSRSQNSILLLTLPDHVTLHP